MATGAARPVSSIDKRRDNRRPRRVMVRYGTRTADKTAFTRNVSENGLFLQTKSVLKPGTTLQVQLKFPDREFLMWARVRWTKKVPPQLAGVLAAGMGIQFIEPSAEWLAFYEENLAR